MKPKTVMDIPYADVTFRLVCHDHMNVELWALEDYDHETKKGNPLGPAKDVKSVTPLGDDFFITFYTGESIWI